MRAREDFSVWWRVRRASRRAAAGTGDGDDQTGDWEMPAAVALSGCFVLWFLTVFLPFLPLPPRTASFAHSSPPSSPFVFRGKNSFFCQICFGRIASYLLHCVSCFASPSRSLFCASLSSPSTHTSFSLLLLHAPLHAPLCSSAPPQSAAASSSNHTLV